MTEEQLRATVVGELRPLAGPIVIVDYDPEWPLRFRREEEKIRAALGDAAMQVEHAGSTSVPGLAAKPIIDIVLVVADSADEDAYVPALERAGYVLRIREPDWFEHRMFRERDTNVNLHVLSRSQIASSTTERSGSSRRRSGGSGRTTRTRRRRSSGRSWRGPALREPSRKLGAAARGQSHL